MKPLLLCYSTITVANCLARVYGQIPPVTPLGQITASAQVRSLRQFYWIRELPSHDEKPGAGRLGYFGSETPVTLIWRDEAKPKSRTHYLPPNVWLSQPLEIPEGIHTLRGQIPTIQIEIE